MLNKFKSISIAILCSINFQAHSATGEKSVFDYDSIWKCDTQKRNWYCDESEQKKPPLDLKKEVATPQPKKGFKDLNKIETVEELQAEVQHRLSLATMNPTPQNMEKIIEVNTFMMDKSSVFADQWRRFVWQNPQHDYSLKNPSNNSAIRVNNQIKTDNKENYLKNISKEHGLIFFFRSDCPYCHQYAPTLKMLSDMYGIEVLAVSIDGGGLPDFPNFRDGRAVAQQWGIEKVPATFIASKKTNERAPIGFGVMSLQEIIERIWVLTNSNPGQEF